VSLADVEAVLFDLGGTVLEIRHDAIAAMLARHGVAPSAGWEVAGEREGRRRMEAQLRSGAARDVVWNAFFEGMIDAAGASPEVSARVLPLVGALHREEHLWARVLDGMDDALAELRARGYRVAAVSNSDGRASAVLADLGLGDRFEFVIDSHDVGVEKPSPAIFALACERLGLPAGRCAYVGDVMAFDVEGARAAGLVPVLFDAYGSYDHAPADGARVTDAAALVALFPGRARRSA
jgi:putative hydrolase of the HAD superfamily